jgi:hypothetical protein
MTQRRLALLFLLLLPAACKKADGLVLVNVTAVPPLTGVTSLFVTVTVTASAKMSTPAQVPLSGSTISDMSPVNFALQLPPAVVGDFTVNVVASGAGGTLATGGVTGHVDAGKTTDPPLQIVLGGGANLDGGDDGPTDLAGADLTLEPPSTPRLLSPLSTSTVTSRHPTLRWELPGGIGTAKVDLCAKRDCSIKIAGSNAVVDASNLQAKVDVDLPPGPVFWRVTVSNGASPDTQSKTWEFFVGARSADGAVDKSFGTTLDANGDGLADLLVGVTGSVVLYPGAAAGFDTGNSETLADADNGFASAVAPAGDFNGDGFGDALASGIYADTDGGSNSGRVLLYLGGLNKLDTAPIQLPIPTVANDTIGTSVAPAGDVDGDGYADVIVSANGNSPGQAFVVFGSANPSGTLRVVTLKPTDNVAGADVTGAQFGSSVAGGDFNGDGYGDVAVGAPGVTQSGKPGGNGRVYLYFGGPSFPATPGLIEGPNFTGCCGGQAFGTSMAEAGDFNGDGRDDLAILAPMATYSYNSCGDGAIDGQTFLYTGAASGAPTNFYLQLPTKATNLASCGGYVTGEIQNRIIAGAGDVDGNGYADFIIGGATATIGGTANAGQVHLILGGPSSYTHVEIPNPMAATPGQFGSAVGGVGSVTGTPTTSNFVVVGNGKVYRFTGTSGTSLQNFSALNAVVTMRDPVRGTILERGELAALVRTRRASSSKGTSVGHAW